MQSTRDQALLVEEVVDSEEELVFGARRRHSNKQRSEEASRRQSEETQAHANRQLWQDRRLLRKYTTRTLRPVEGIILLRYRNELTKRVLELGCGGGRVTGYLGVLSPDVHAIDLSPTMVNYCRKTYPDVAFEVADLRDLSKFGDAQFDVVTAWGNVLDVLADTERRRVLRDIRRILSRQGLLIMSSHNLAYAPRIRTPTQLRYRDPARLAVDIARLPRSLVNRRRLKRFEHTGAGFAILNDVSHDFRALNYYISRDAQGRQFEQEHFELLDCLDDDEGRVVLAGDDAARHNALHYVARSRP